MAPRSPSSTEIACPACGTRLRLREPFTDGRRFPCPDCRTALSLERAAGSSSPAVVVAAVAPESPTRSAVPQPRTIARLQSTLTGWTRGVLGWLLQPLTVAWGGALLVACGVGMAILQQGATSTASRNATDPQSSTNPGLGGASATAGNTAKPLAPTDVITPPGNGGAPVDPSMQGPPIDVAQDRLAALGRELMRHRDHHQAYPVGTVNPGNVQLGDRFSWMAQLAADLPGVADRPLVNWEQGWRHPVNDPFVRRPMRDYLNPAVEAQASEDRFPVTHYVGVAGVGSDGPLLPATHPRAGIFAYDRATRREQILDGESNTLLVLGVTENLASWASGRDAIRPVTHAPYVNGPDGFGTGRADAMQVLMADGSVRTVPRTIDGTVFRRMAAMADGLPLDPEVPGEPGDQRPAAAMPADPEPAAVPPPPAAALPLAPLPVDKRPAIDRTWEQPIRLFRQSKPLPRRELIGIVEELLGRRVEIDRDQLGAEGAALDEPITLDLQDTTPAAILAEIFSGTALTIERDGDKLTILVRE